MQLVINRKDVDFFSKITPEACNYYFIKISTSNWVKLLNFLPEKTTTKIVDDVMLNVNEKVLEHLLAMLNEMQKANTLSKLVTLQISKVPVYLETVLAKVDNSKVLLNKLALQNLLAIDSQSNQSENWKNQVADLLLKCTNRNYLNNVLLPTLLEATNQTELTLRTLDNCKVHYQKIASSRPLPPKDWVRQVPTSPYHKREWEILRSFIESPSMEVLEYRKPQRDRVEMESAIRSVTCDLRTETIKKGSPHMLLITKTQNDYKRKLNDWEQDVTLLDKIIQRIKDN
jgi:hypothetical protein